MEFHQMKYVTDLEKLNEYGCPAACFDSWEPCIFSSFLFQVLIILWGMLCEIYKAKICTMIVFTAEISMYSLPTLSVQIALVISWLCETVCLQMHLALAGAELTENSAFFQVVIFFDHERTFPGIAVGQCEQEKVIMYSSDVRFSIHTAPMTVVNQNFVKGTQTEKGSLFFRTWKFWGLSNIREK